MRAVTRLAEGAPRASSCLATPRPRPRISAAASSTSRSARNATSCSSRSGTRPVVIRRRGPLPRPTPDPESPSMIQGRARMSTTRWRSRASAGSRRGTAPVDPRPDHGGGRAADVPGTPASVAAEINRSVQDDACGSSVLVPHLIPAGLDKFARNLCRCCRNAGVPDIVESRTTLRDISGWARAARRLMGRRSEGGVDA